MSEHEAAARYEHATTILDWNHATSAPPVLSPPTDDPGWMLFSQNAALHAFTTDAEGLPVTRFLCVWRRRLVVPREKAVPAPSNGKRPGRKARSEPPAADDDEEGIHGLY